MVPSRSWLIALVLFGASSSFAQTDSDAGTVVLTDVETLRRELDATKKDLREMREEMRAQSATQTAAQGWSEDFVEEKRKLEVFVPDGYFRIRPELLYRMELGRNADPGGYRLFPLPPTSVNDPVGTPRERTLAGVNMRFRFEPTFNISEEVRIRMQVDALDNVLMGSTPDYAFSRDPNHVYDRDSFSIQSESINAPRSGVNALSDSIAVKRIWGEVSTPVGILRFGRMGSQWGMGMTHNDGNCLDCDFGDTVDRIQFVAEPLAGYFITPMIDINAEGPSSYQSGSGDIFDASNSDDAHSAVIAVARRDTETQARARLEAGQTVFNYGAYFAYRWQRNDAADYLGTPFTSPSATNTSAGYVARNGQLWMPDIWAKFERGNLRLELEASGLIGNITNIALTGADGVTPGKNQGIGLMQFGGVLQGEYKLLDGALSIQAEIGFASGDDAPGFGNYPRRQTRLAQAGGANITSPGEIDGPQYACPNTGFSGGCTDSVIKNFRFNRDYRVDMILFREILGGVTDALYLKPTVRYRIADGFTAWGSVIYSRAVYMQSTPSYHLLADGTKAGDSNLGFEINLGARYETEDGFFGELRWGILFPLGGFFDPRTTAAASLDSSQSLRGAIGIKF